MSVIGTAGHIDHGKSALVNALTGIDPDRLQEEKERGMTIDLGFAWLMLPSGREAGIVDVPGHEGFIKNMLAGVGGIDVALLVIAADDGAMPQTREHLTILDLLNVKRGLVAVTKTDLVDGEWLEMVVSDVEEVIKPTFLAGAPVLPVSSITGEGTPELLTTIDRLLGELPPKRDLGRPRLPVDRAFTMPGFGTVVTGTLIDGRLAVGQEVQVVPGGLRTRIRGLQAHRRKLEVAEPGTRVAVNLHGIPPQDLERGVVVTTPGWLTPTPSADVKLTLVADAPASLTHGAGAMVHLLAGQVAGRVRLLDRDELKPGETGWAQVRFAQPLATVRGDRFIIRNAAGTVGGGQIVEAHPPRHRRFHPGTLERLAAGEHDPRAALLQLLEKREPCEVRDLLKNLGLSPEEARAVIEQVAAEGAVVALGDQGVDERAILITAAGWARVLARTEEVLSNYHKQYPLRAGMPKEEFKSRLRFGPRAAAKALDWMLRDGQLAGGRLVKDGPLVRLADHEVRPTPQHVAGAGALLSALEGSPYSPPTDLHTDAEIVSWLIEQRKVVRIGDGILFAAPAYDRMAAWVVDYIKANGRISHVELREHFDNSRRIAFALLEHLDQEHITRRVGNNRVLR
ncbi:MAG TPA: selenocysteine-specific translation elongation factor [Dehalococcoidia bacterium]|nr:selenocysteine-specific translation elongation factor [Dehalococcoidia bacterium]